MRCVYLVFIILFSSIAMESFSQFTIDGQFRNRSYVNYGYGNLPRSGDVPATIIEQRTRLNVNYRIEKMEFYMSFQDSRVWGQEYGEHNISLGLNEAYINFLINPALNIKIGRQDVGYNDNRLISDLDWSNWGSALDIARLQYKNLRTGLSTDFSFGVNNKRNSPYQTSFDVRMFRYFAFWWINKKFLNDKISISMLNILNSENKPDKTIVTYDTIILMGGEEYVVENRNTIEYPNILYTTLTSGIYYNIDISKLLTFNGQTYIQTGKLVDGRKLFSYFYALEMAINFDKFGFELGYEVASGTDLSDSVSAQKEAHSFNYNIYGYEGNPFFGEMNYFLSPQSTNWAGIRDLLFTIWYKPGRKFTANLVIHYFSLDKPYITPLLKVDKYLATEIDFKLKYDVNDQLSIGFLYGFMLPQNSLKQLQDLPVTEKKLPQFGRLQILWSPTFLTNN